MKNPSYQTKASDVSLYIKRHGRKRDLGVEDKIEETDSQIKC